GCGDARVSRRLAGEAGRPLGGGYFGVSLKTPGFPPGAAAPPRVALPAAPFRPVPCAGGLQHPPAGVVEGTVEELKRVARRYVLVSVPNREKLTLLQSKCSRCRTAFHIWGHVRAFSSGKLDRLFGLGRAAITRSCGDPRPFQFGFV